MTGFIGLFESGAQVISTCTFLQQNIESVKTNGLLFNSLHTCQHGNR